jgi:hypothetical protein
MRAFLAILVVAVTLAVASQTVSAAQYLLAVEYASAGCSATSGNKWTQATVSPTDSCFIDNSGTVGVKKMCNATHLINYDCTAVNGTCDCTVTEGANPFFFLLLPVLPAMRLTLSSLINS